MNLVDVAIKRPVFITMVTFFFIVVGVLALKKLSVDLYPDVNYPVLVVRSTLPGAAPEEMEQLITKRMEDALSTIAGIQTMTSVSREGSANVIMEFTTGTDVRFQEIQVRGKIANLRSSFPDAMKEPEIFRQDPDDTPIVEVAVSGKRSIAEITNLADNVIARSLRQLQGVGSVDLIGGRDPEVWVDLKPEALDQWHLNSTDIVTAIKNGSRNDPVGQLEGKNRRWTVRSVAEARVANDLGSIGVSRASNGQPLFLRDVADVYSTFEDVTRISRFGDKTSLQPAVILNILKQSGENTVRISDRVRAGIEALKKQLPPDVKIEITRDNADLVRSNVLDVTESLGLGALLTVCVVMLFLRSPRSTITTALSLPSSVITTFAVMYAAKFTVNVMTLLALSLAVGLLVDDAIVVRENIFRHLHDPDPRKAAAKGAKEVALAVVATTLTIVAVFLPVGFMGGISGQMFRQFALTVVFAVLVSLWDAMTMAPMLSAYFANIADPADEWKVFGRAGKAIDGVLIKFEHLFEALARFYGRVLKGIVPRPWIALAFAGVAMAGAVGGFMIVKKSFLPTQFGRVFSVSLNGPLALPINSINDQATLVESRLKAINGLENWTVRAGVGYGGNANIDLTLRVSDDFAQDQDSLGNVRQDVRKALTGIPGYIVRVSEPADPLAGSSGRFQPLAVVISGDDIGTLRDIGRAVRAEMVAVHGVVDVQPIQDEGIPELQLKTSQDLAAQFGVTAATVGTNLSTWIQGDISNSLRVGDDQIPIRVRLRGAKNLAPSDLLALNLYVKGTGTKADVSVPLGNVVRLTSGAGPNVINRENRQRIMRVGGNLAPGAALGDIVTELNDRLTNLPLPQGYAVRIVGQNEQMAELFSNVLLAIGIGTLFVYMILAGLFESFLQPITVMAAIPLAGTGAVAALLLSGSALDLYSGVGMILLAGIVAKNSILLVDFAMQRVHAGEDPRTAILESAPLRLRPIVMTSLAMIAGMIPVAMGLGASGAARRGLGLATIGGILSSTVLTLLIVPSLFLVVSKVIEWSNRGKKSAA